MLTRDELAEVAGLKRLTLKNAERDYLQGLFSLLPLRRGWQGARFQRGTCLYKLHGLNRFSEDLDFTLVRPVDLDEVMGKTVRQLRFFGVYAEVAETKKYPREANFRLLFRGPLFTGNRGSLCFIPVNVSLGKGSPYPSEQQVTLPRNPQL